MFFSYRKILIGIFVLFLFFGENVFAQKAKSSKTRKRSHITLQQRKINNQLQQALEDIAFSPNYLESKSAMNFLLDHTKLSLTPLKGLLNNTDIPPKNLLNIWNIVHYILDDEQKPRFSCSKIHEFLNTQKNKQLFLSQVVDDYLDDCPDLKDQVLSWLTNPSVLQYQSAFLIVQKHKMLDLSPIILRQTIASINSLRQEMGLSALLALAPKDLDITSLLTLFDSPVSIIRYKVAQIFSLHPEDAPILMKYYKDSSSDLGKVAIVSALVTNSSDEVFDFITKIYLKDPASSTEAGRFFLIQTVNSERVLKLLKLLKKADDESAKLNLLYIIYSLVPHFQNNPTILQEIRTEISKTIPDETGLISRFMQKIVIQIDTFL